MEPRRKMNSLEALAGILFLFFFVPSRLYLIWVNYKARFRYGLWEHSPLWRKLDKKIGVFTFVIDFAFSILVVLVLSALIASLFRINPETALSLVLSGAVGLTFTNAAFDRISVNAFEKICLNCNNKEKCMNFHNENCALQPAKQRSASAFNYRKKKKETA
jgi:hypothetical protein